MKVVVEDPGHGFIDSGAIGPAGTYEKDNNLSISLLVAKKLKQNPNLKMYMTRASDEVTWSQATATADLQARCDIANALVADIFISIHCDSYTDPSAKGTTAYCYQFGGEGERLARCIHEELLKVPGVAEGAVYSAQDELIKIYGNNYQSLVLPDHGVKQAAFYVLKNTDMPAALFELGFISNPDEEQMLCNPAFQEAAAEAIARGVLKYFGFSEEEKPQYNMGKVAINPGTTYVPLNGFLKAHGIGEVTDWDGARQEVKYRLGEKEYSLLIGGDKIQEV